MDAIQQRGGAVGLSLGLIGVLGFERNVRVFVGVLMWMLAGVAVMIVKEFAESLTLVRMLKTMST